MIKIQKSVCMYWLQESSINVALCSVSVDSNGSWVTYVLWPMTHVTHSDLWTIWPMTYWALQRRCHAVQALLLITTTRRRMMNERRVPSVDCCEKRFFRVLWKNTPFVRLFLQITRFFFSSDTSVACATYSPTLQRGCEGQRYGK